MARTRIARFNIQITASAEQVREVFSRLGKQTTSWRRNLASGITAASFAFNQITQAIGPVIAKFAEMAQRLDELAKTAARLRIAPEFLQTLELAGARLGIELSTIQTGLRDLQDRIGDIRRGTASRQLGDALAQIGLGDGNLSQDLGTAFLQIRKGISEIDDAAVRASVAAELFGRSGKQMLLIFEQTGGLENAAKTIDQLGQAFTAEELAKLEQFNDSWADILLTFRSLGEIISVNLAEPLLAVSEILKSMIKNFRELSQIPIIREIIGATPGGTGMLANIFGMGGTGSAQQTLARIQPPGETDVKKILEAQLKGLRAIQKNTSEKAVVVEGSI